ncbi:Cytochrome c-552 [Pseudomonas extremaustralis]|uniref:c-type cytochrome n=1 Tax=Pseudomonas extremaustralis TaxID=359110 RepID=UPI002AA0B9DF|nr:c-type cytochrome [Pseudomonas extremaustralis]MDY7065464.1 Cytochrome c-552 [Pseudomonas extremaustralis]
MINKSLCIALIIIFDQIGTAYADGAALAEAKGCTVCHSAKTEKIGPSFRDISHRFHGFKNARPMLVRVVQTGTDTAVVPYHWGSIKMPSVNARTPVSQEEAEQLIDYILSIR